jgi:phosphoserine phosphatase
MDERVLLVDLCGTLYDSNTTFDFLKYLLADNEDYARFESSSLGLPYRIYNRLMPGDIRRERAIAFLKGHQRSELEASANLFFETIRPIKDVHDFLSSLRADYDRAVIMSSSLDFIVESACERLGFDAAFGTRLSYIDGSCDGTIAEDLLGNKHTIILREFTGMDCALVTDNREDVACEKVVNRLIGVAPAEDRRAMSFWSTRVNEVVAVRE